MSGNTIFSGSSRYANDFQQIIERAVAIASLPLSQLNKQKEAMTAQSTALSDLDTKFSALQTALDNLQKATGGSSLSAALSDSTVARATLSAGALEGVYSLSVITLGAQTSTLSSASLPKVSDPATGNISAAASFTLSVGGTNYTITPSANSLSQLVQAINASPADVRATLINLGTSAAPDYRLSIQSSKLGNISIQLNDGAANLLDVLSTGSPATYQINGQPTTPISSDSRTVTISPGLSVDLLKAGTTDITVSRTPGSIRDSITALVTAFNAAVDEVDKHRGQSKGALAGHSLIFSLGASLRQIGGYSGGSGSLKDLTALGLTFNKQGKLVFDPGTFDGAAASDFDSLLSFLGSTTTSGFLKSASTSLNNLEDSTSGILQTAISSLKKEILDQDKRIGDNQSRISLMRETLTARIAAADALIASLEQNVILFNGLFEAQRQK